MRLLIADDDDTTRFMLAGILNKWGLTVIEAKNGAEALAALQGHDAPEMAILDWMMPEMDGIEVLRNIRTFPCDHPAYIIMLTTKNEKEDIITGLEAGADDYLGKPFSPGELKARVGVGRRLITLRTRLSEQIVTLKKALDDNKVLRGILPICMYCKKIRNDQGYWDQVEAYLSQHSTAEFSHSICPVCLENHYPDHDQKPGPDEGS